MRFGNGNTPYKLETALDIYRPISVGDPLEAWKGRAHQRGDLPREYLTPRLMCKASQDEFVFIRREAAMPADAMQRAIDDLAPWTYHVEAGGATTRGRGTYDDGTIRFHRHRANLIAATVAKMLGEDTKESSVLDLGCNCGFFTLEMAARGVQQAVGIDFRQENLDQAEFLKNAFGVENAEFRIQNVKDIEDSGQKFDVILNLGLMYHLSSPYEVMQTCYGLTNKFCVIDTITHTEPFSGYHVLIKDSKISIEGDLDFELQPTYRGMLDTIKAAGFKEVIEVVAPVKGVGQYDDGSRRCLIAFKDPSDKYLARLT